MLSIATFRSPRSTEPTIRLGRCAGVTSQQDAQIAQAGIDAMK